jgi:hypothetical protein
MAKTNRGGEVAAMGAVEGALEPLSPDERGRVIRWAAERFEIQVAGKAPASPANPTRPKPARVAADGEAAEDVGDFYTRAAPETQTEQALVVAYWVQEIQGKGEFDSQTVNTQLKHLGHGVSNITRALDELKNRKPQLVIQIEKAGKSKQARKRYKVTAAGKKAVEKLLAGEREEEQE